MGVSMTHLNRFTPQIRLELCHGNGAIIGRRMSLRTPPPSSSHLSSEERREQTLCFMIHVTEILTEGMTET